MASGQCRNHTAGSACLGWLIIAGEHDIADVHAHCGAIEAAIPAARCLILRGGHLPYFEVPGEFNTAVLGFLTTHLHRSERG
jgi:pimeloyl-ACP methyl ester carboxylesterase